MSHTIIQAECLEWLREQGDCSFSTIVTDAPYGYKFMSKKWDYDVPSVEVWQEALRVLKPGGTLLCFAGPRTLHRMMVNIEDAGFRICDLLMWVHGQGFAKGQDIGKNIDKKAGAKRKIIGPSGRHKGGVSDKYDQSKWTKENAATMGMWKTAPATKAAKQWDGWKTHGMSPGYEPIVMAMKANDGSYADNALKHGVAGINIDACRTPIKGKDDYGRSATNAKGTVFAHDGFEGKSFKLHERKQQTSPLGRYPKNFLHDGSQLVLNLFPEGRSSGGGGRETGERGGKGNFWGQGKLSHDGSNSVYHDKGSAARFYPELGFTEDELRLMYQAKVSKKDRGEGNTHPTCKPQTLMRWLVRLVCPPGGTVLDLYMGSGTTGVACQLEGFNFIGIEREADYFDMAARRLKVVTVLECESGFPEKQIGIT